MPIKAQSVNKLLVLLISLGVSIPLPGCGPPQTELDAPTAEIAATQTAAAPRPTLIPLASLRPLFDYDSEAALDIEEVSIEYHDRIAVHDLSYASPMGGRVTAYLVVPPGEGSVPSRRFAGIIFAHPGGGSRDFFLDEAMTLARTGAVSLLIDAPWARPEPWRRELDYTPINDRDIYIQDIVDLRRGVDLLLSREEVDPERLGFVGHSYGAHMGGVLAGLEMRIKAYVFMAGVSSQSDRIPKRITSALRSEDLAAYLEAIIPLDAVHYVGHAAPAALFFQCAREDEIIVEETSWRYYEAGSQPKQITWYDAGHSLNDQARLDRARWLAEQIGLDGSALE